MLLATIVGVREVVLASLLLLESRPFSERLWGTRKNYPLLRRKGSKAIEKYTGSGRHQGHTLGTSRGERAWVGQE